MKSSLSHGCTVARALALTLVVAASYAAAPARAWEYPLLPHVHGLAFFPEPPSNELQTTANLSAVYPGECWELVDTLVVDSAHVRVTVRRNNDCSDSVSTWNHSFYLGVLAAGMHELNVHCTVLEDGQPPVEEEITVPFEVVQAPSPPPPPPYTLPLLEIVAVMPPRPAPGEPVTIRLRGFKPFECTLIHGEQVVSQTQIQMEFDQDESCADTTQRWQRDFFMGSYPAGDHRVDIRLVVNRPDSSSVQDHAALVWVRDPSVPPPIDSTVQVLHSVSVEPAAPTVGDFVTVRARGRMPFECGRVQEVLHSGYGLLWVTLVHGTSCTDTSRAWEASWDLGPLAGGDHQLDLDVRLQVGGMSWSRHYPVHVHVTDPNAPPPPPPPPPVDSVRAGLSPSKPNPFRDQTNFSVSLEESQSVEVAVFDLVGRRVATIHRGVLPQGTSSMAWNGRRSDGSRAPGGIYFYRLTRAGQVVNRRVVLLGSP